MKPEDSFISVCGYKVRTNKVLGLGLVFPFVEAEKEGTLYLAHCIKLSDLTKKTCELINNETKYLQTINFPNIVKRIGNPITDKRHLLILYEYCNLGSISYYLKNNSLTIELLKRIAHQVMKALCVLSTLHHAVVALCPDSVFLHEDNNKRIHVIVCDLMLVQKINSPMLKCNEFTYLYKNCERENVDTQTDIHAFGTLMISLGKYVELKEHSEAFHKLVDTCFDDKVEKELGAVIFSKFMHQDGKLEKKYKDIKKIGRGGQGEVCVAKRIDEEFNDNGVAIKNQNLSLHTDYYSKRELKLAATEIKSLYGLSSTLLGRKYCVILLDHFIDDNKLYIIMERCDAKNLRHYMKQPLDDMTIVKITKDIALGLVAIDNCRIIHRDIKPENVVFNEGKERTAKLCDFGISKHRACADSFEDISICPMNLTYLPPEICEFKQGVNFDVWGLGAILYEMRFKKTPSKAKIEFLEDTDHRIKELITRCLEKNPEERMSAAEVVEFISDKFNI